MPTLNKKKGMKIALPTNSTRFMSGDVEGISRLRVNPTKNAPMMASRPAACARNAPRKTIASTKIYWEMLSCTRLKNQRAMKGNPSNTMSVNRMTESPSRTQNMSSALPVANATTTVSTSSASVSVIIVPPTVMLTALFRLIPKRLMIG